MADARYLKQPGENLDYDFNFAAVLATGDTIASAVITSSPSGLTIGTKTNSTTTVKQYLSGGTAGATYIVTCRATTVAGRIHELDLELRVLEQ